MAKEWTGEEKDIFLEKYRTHSDAEISLLLKNRTPNAVNHYRRSMGLSKMSIAPSNYEIFDGRISLSHRNICILGDVHLPTHDGPFIEKVVNLALKAGVTTLILAGDLMNVDAFSKYGSSPEQVFANEVESTTNFLSSVCPWFDETYWFMGNHEARFFKQVNLQLGVEHLKRLVKGSDRLIISKYQSMDMDAAAPSSDRMIRYPWHITHQRNHSIIPGKVATTMSERRYSRFHVVTTHEHSRASTVSSDGERQIFATGMCGSPERIEYYNIPDSTSPAMIQGALLIYDDRGEPVWPGCNWDGMERKLAGGSRD